MEFITNNKGSRKLFYEGYAYTKKSQNKSSVRWECSQRRALSCHGTLTSDILVTDVKSTTAHSHAANDNVMQAMKLKVDLKVCAETNRGNPGQIVTDKLSELTKEVVVAAEIG